MEEENKNTNENIEDENTEENPYDKKVREYAEECKDSFFEFFLLDTETNGFNGLYNPHRNHYLLQLCLIHVVSGEVFNKIVKPGKDVSIAKQSTAIHGLTEEYLNESGECLESVIYDCFSWLEQKTGTDPVTGEKKEIMFIAHNAAFDRDILVKSIIDAKHNLKESTISNEKKEFLSKIKLGKGCSTIKWHFYDTLEEIKTLYPLIKYNAYEEAYKAKPFDGQAHKLQSLMKHFFPDYEIDIAGNFHNAVYDTFCLRHLFMLQLYPKRKEFFMSRNAKFEIKGLLSYSTKCDDNQILLLVPLHTVKWIGIYNAEKLCNYCNAEFVSNGPEWEIYATSTVLFTAAHLMMYAFMKIKKNTGVKYDRRSKQKDGMNDLDIWWLICREIETIFRTELLIYSETTILTLLSYVLSSTPTEIIYNLKKLDFDETGSDQFFPTMPGEPISYRPFLFTEENAMVLYKKWNIRSLNDMYITYQCLPQELRNQWRLNIMASLTPDQRQNFENYIFDKCLGEVIPFYLKT